MSTPSLVPMIAQDGSIGDIPADKVDAAVSAGFKRGINVISKDGQKGTIPLDSLGKAMQNGMLPEHAMSARQPMDAIGNAPTGVKAFLNNLEGDIRYGTGSTIPGKILQFMGAPGINRGVPQAVSDQVAGPLIGPVTAAQGVTQIPQKPVAGTLQALKGVLQTVSPALSFAAPEAGEGVTNAAQSVASRLPTKSNAGQLFNAVKQVAGDANVDPNNAGEVALRIQELAKSGGSMPKVIRDFLARTTNPGEPPLDFNTARDIYSNATRLSAAENSRLTGVMQSQMNQFTRALGQSIQEAAAQSGKGEEFGQAMSKYRTAARISNAKQALLDYIVKPAIKAAPLGIGAAAGYKVYEAAK